ncbi:metacaspase [Gregarina niphandrodes]|uniref:Metacaspase n=1 Tax=Gregarina niphandrodes TaxID=110365 RepID=A0A023B5G9_GRENI|nr:metacaspase [Gregarina niphandrodes]EZG59486.1 metacaspase [Gregarina niphandrodes]|eukprot:XP_011130889.1 metacaspase [Gregarina niphandrodes]
MEVLGVGRRKALLIGINYFGTRKELNGCVDDVYRMKNLITSVFGFVDDPLCMTLLTDRPGYNKRLSPSRRNCLGAMRWLVKDSGPGDLLFFHYSGHGGQKRNTKGTELTGFDETIMPLDYKTAGHITDDELNNVLVKDLPAGVRLVCVMDCCHSGSGLDLPYYWPIDAHFKENIKKGAQVWTRELYPKMSDAHVILISSCQDTETAADLLIPGWGAGGAVTLGLVTTITNASNPHQVSFYELAKTLRKFLSDRKFTQSPQISTTQPFDPMQRTFDFS